MYVETKGPTLEEMVKIIDGPDAQVSGLDQGKLVDDTKVDAEFVENKN